MQNVLKKSKRLSECWNVLAAMAAPATIKASPIEVTAGDFVVVVNVASF